MRFRTAWFAGLAAASALAAGGISVPATAGTNPTRTAGDRTAVHSRRLLGAKVFDTYLRKQFAAR